VDVLTADAIRELQGFRPGKPIILAESGAVEPGHTGPFKLYEKDKAGTILHDILFVPFFAGAAGPGQCWHWDSYVDRNDLWWQFARFAEVVKNLDPPAEGFEPLMLDHLRLRVYVLKGKRTTLLWCRDAANAWKTELAEGKNPGLLTDVSLNLGRVLDSVSGLDVRTYDPWENRWTTLSVEGKEIVLPPFRRSLVVRIRRETAK
jgi:hypothetical protein